MILSSHVPMLHKREAVGSCSRNAFDRIVEHFGGGVSDIRGRREPA
jgi:hypothetical protein